MRLILALLLVFALFCVLFLSQRSGPEGLQREDSSGLAVIESAEPELLVAPAAEHGDSASVALGPTRGVPAPDVLVAAEGPGRIAFGESTTFQGDVTAFEFDGSESLLESGVLTYIWGHFDSRRGVVALPGEVARRAVVERGHFEVQGASDRRRAILSILTIELGGRPAVCVRKHVSGRMSLPLKHAGPSMENGTYHIRARWPAQQTLIATDSTTGVRIQGVKLVRRKAGMGASRAPHPGPPTHYEVLVQGQGPILDLSASFVGPDFWVGAGGYAWSRYSFSPGFMGGEAKGGDIRVELDPASDLVVHLDNISKDALPRPKGEESSGGPYLVVRHHRDMADSIVRNYRRSGRITRAITDATQYELQALSPGLYTVEVTTGMGKLASILASVDVRLLRGRTQTVSLDLGGQNLRRDLVPCEARIFWPPANGEAVGSLFLSPKGIPGQPGVRSEGPSWEALEGQPGWYRVMLGPLRAGEYRASYHAFDPIHEHSPVFAELFVAPEQGCDDLIFELPELLPITVRAQWENGAGEVALSEVIWCLDRPEDWSPGKSKPTRFGRRSTKLEHGLVLPVTNLLVTPIASNVLLDPIPIMVTSRTREIVLPVKPNMSARVQFDGPELPEDLEAFVADFVSVDCRSTKKDPCVYDSRWISAPRGKALWKIRFTRKGSFGVTLDPESGWHLNARGRLIASERDAKILHVQLRKKK